MEEGLLQHQWELLSHLMAHIEQQNPYIKQPRFAWQFNPFELAGWTGPPDDYQEFEAELSAEMDVKL